MQPKAIPQTSKGERYRSIDFMFSMFTIITFEHRFFNIYFSVVNLNGYVTIMLTVICMAFAKRRLMQNNRIKDLQPEYRPDEKFLAFGPKALSDAELLAIILRTGSTQKHSVDLAREILNGPVDSHLSILNIIHYEFHELMKIRGIGKVKAIQIKAIAELSLRISRAHARSSLDFHHPETVARYYMEQLRHEKREQVVLLMLNSACDLLKELVISTGTVNAALLSPREIFIQALRYEAVGIILMHNHPSGEPVPSEADLLFTEQIRGAAELIGIRLIDHIIIGDRSYYSFKENEWIHE